MAKYYEYEKQAFSCSSCGWEGTGLECEMGDLLSALFEIHCPKCGERVGFVEFPLISEMSNSDDPLDRMTAAVASGFRANFKKKCLKSPDQLPEIANQAITLVWDSNSKDGTTPGDVLIKDRGVVIWREPETFEGYQRFIEVGEILKMKYGKQLKDFTFTENSEFCLGGDHLGAFGHIEYWRKKLKEENKRLQ